MHVESSPHQARWGVRGLKKNQNVLYMSLALLCTRVSSYSPVKQETVYDRLRNVFSYSTTAGRQGGSRVAGCKEGCFGAPALHTAIVCRLWRKIHTELGLLGPKNAHQQLERIPYIEE